MDLKNIKKCEERLNQILQRRRQMRKNLEKKY
jgi:hypothetical protein